MSWNTKGFSGESQGLDDARVPMLLDRAWINWGFRIPFVEGGGVKSLTSRRTLQDANVGCNPIRDEGSNGLFTYMGLF